MSTAYVKVILKKSLKGKQIRIIFQDFKPSENKIIKSKNYAIIQDDLAILCPITLNINDFVMAGAGLLGKMVLPASIVSDGIKAVNGDISGAEFGLNTSVGVYSAFSGPLGWTVGGGYSLIDATIGWGKAMELNANYYNLEREMLPIGSGIPTKVY